MNPTVTGLERVNTLTPGTEDAAHLRSWQLRIFWLLWGAYASYYLCRVNFAVAQPAILKEFPGWTNAKIGTIPSVYAIFYAVGTSSTGHLESASAPAYDDSRSGHCLAHEPAILVHYLVPSHAGALGHQRLRPVSGVVAAGAGPVELEHVETPRHRDGADLHVLPGGQRNVVAAGRGAVR